MSPSVSYLDYSASFDLSTADSAAASSSAGDTPFANPCLSMDFFAVAAARSQVSYRPDFARASSVGLISAFTSCSHFAGDYGLHSAFSWSIYAFCGDGFSIICTFGYHSVSSLFGFAFAVYWRTR